MAIDVRGDGRLEPNSGLSSRGAHFRSSTDAGMNHRVEIGSHSRTHARRFGVFPLKRTVIAAATVLVMCAAGGAVAWFGAQDNVLNTFTRGGVTPSIEETFDKTSNVKENVYVANKGTTPAYMRATVSVYWEDEQGNQLWEPPVENVDYKIAWGAVSEGANPCWIEGNDGYYYWSAPVGVKEQTSNLIDSVTKVGDHGAKRLVVDISTQGVQANITAGKGFDEAWSASSGLKVDTDGVLVPTGN